MNILAFDTNSLFARTWYATADKPDAATHPDTGLVIEATRVCVKIILSLLDPTNDRIGEKIDRVVFAWDTVQKNDKERGARSPDYDKEKLFCAELLSSLFGPDVNSAPHGFEADDIVCTVVEQREKGDVVYVVSGDKDLHQLMTPTVRLYCLNTKAVIAQRQVLNKWHVARPDQVAIALAIIGDSVDKIKGVYGWGPKKASSITKQFTAEMSMEECYNLALSKLPAGECREQFETALDLTLLDPGVPGVRPATLLQFLGDGVLAELGLFEEDAQYNRVARRYRKREADELEEFD